MKGWWLRLLSHVNLRDRGLIVIVAAILLNAIMTIIRPWPLKLIIDNILSGQPLPQNLFWLQQLPGAGSPEVFLAWMAGATVLIYITTQVISVARDYSQTGVGKRMIYALAGDLFDHLQRLSLRFHTSQRAGDLVQRVTSDTTCARDLVLNVLLPSFSSIITLALMFVVMFSLDPYLTFFALLLTPLIVVMVRRTSTPMRERTYKQRKLEGEMTALAEQTLTAMPVVQAYGREEMERQRFRELASTTYRAYLAAMITRVKFNLGLSTITAAGTAIIMVLGGLHVIEGSLTVGGLLVFLSYLEALYAPLETLANVSVSFATAGAGAKRVLEIMDVEQEVKDAPDAASLPPASGRGARITLEGVTFGYQEGRPVLHDIDLDVRPGETIALVGPTGAGKSTLVGLISRFFDPWKGRVMFDGTDLRKVKVSSLRSNISSVLQDPYLLPLTVAENISFGRPEAQREEVLEAAVAAGADEFICKLPQGYDTVIGERGITLSGGQRQRLAIARAFLRDAPVLILDEPTSALDARTEADLLATLERLKKGRTTFIIAHRLSTIRDADRIVVLKDGKVVEVGSHHELMMRGGTYSTFYGLQSGTFTETGRNDQ